MDGPAIECSDSDSGESWTLLENSIHTDGTQDLSELPGESTKIENHEKDEDTDGISIISDSEPDSPSPCQLNYEISNDENHSSDHENTQFISVDSQLNNVENDEEANKDDDDLLGDNRRKNKTYVHRRNKRLSTVLNIVVLASIITAAGVAIGHMWGAKSDCTLNNTPGVNKILSRLYRLQEENAYLRSKLKEITVLNSYQANNKSPIKQNKCRKMFEDSLQNDDSKKLVTTCVDGRVDIDDRLFKSHMIQPPYEREFGQDRKLRNVYVQNRSWINEKAIKKIIQEKDKSIKNMKNAPNIYVENNANQKYEFNNNKVSAEKNIDNTERHFNDGDSLKLIDKHKKITKRDAKESFNDHIKLDGKNEHIDYDFYDKNMPQTSQFKMNERTEFSNEIKSIDKFNKNIDNKIFNKAFEHDMNEKISDIDQDIDVMFSKDGEGTDKLNTRDHKTFKTPESENKNPNDDNESNQTYDELKPENRLFFKKDFTKVFARKEDINKNSKDNNNIDTDSSFEEVKKDNRYTAPKHKPERKKYDRHKSHKKEKKRNKYEQWEMKGGLMKDYDDISWSSVSSWSDDSTYSGTEQNVRGDIGENLNYDSGTMVGVPKQVLPKEGDDIIKQPCTDNKNCKAKSEQVTNWVDRRAINRMEARKTLEKELFGDDIAAAEWYFKRMRKREQCRAKGDNNSTYRKLSKRFKNHKTKQ